MKSMSHIFIQFIQTVENINILKYQTVENITGYKVVNS